MKNYSIKLFHIFIIISTPLLVKAQANDYFNFSGEKETLSVRIVNNQYIFHNQDIFRYSSFEKKKLNTLKIYSKRNTYARALRGNIFGGLAGGLAGLYVANLLTDKRNIRGNPDHSMAAAMQIAIGGYIGVVLGSPIGTTYTLRENLSLKQKGTIFAISMAPYISHICLSYLAHQFKVQKSYRIFFISFGVSIPFSAILPAYYYNKHYLKF